MLLLGSRLTGRFRLPSMNPLKPICQLQPGETARVECYLRQCSFCLRLQELGLLPGTEVRCIRAAPVSGLLEICVRGCHLALRQEDTRSILVRPS